MSKIVLATGGFDPLHGGHIEYFEAAKELGDKLIVGINSDEWLERKKGKAFMPWNERVKIINNLQMVDEVFTFMDDDDSAINFIKQVKAHYPYDQLIFANGGDRTADNIPEMIFNDVEFVFGVGGTNKINSSSTIDRVQRNWGWYKILYNAMTTKVKELQIEPGQSISVQRHSKRNEFWFVVKGECTASKDDKSVILTAHKQFTVPTNTWHTLYNHTNKPCNIVEIQYGECCEESDIERQDLHGL